MEVVSQETGEILTLAEAAKEIPRPSYWRRTEGIIEGNVGQEYEEAFFAVQTEIGPLVEAEKENGFTKNKYASLAQILAKLSPVLVKNKITLRQGAGRMISHGQDGPKKQLFLPVWTEVRHVPTGQWERVYIELPLVSVEPKAVGSCMTFGRRYLIQSLFGLASTDDDGVLAGYRASLNADPIGEVADGLVEQINACKTIDELKAWNSRNEEGFSILSEERFDKIREAFKARKEAIKANPPAEKPAKKSKIEVLPNGTQVAYDA